MTIPGFTAEAAVSDSRGPTYAMADTMGAPAKVGVVVPQACVNIGPCQVCVTFRAFPPKACFSLRCPLGIGFSRCIP